MSPTLVRRLLIGVALAAGTGYVLHLAGPLRLTHDATLLLGSAAALADGRGLAGSVTPHPPGYPGAVAVLETAGFPFPAALVLLNQLLLAAGLVAAWRILRSSLLLDAVEAGTICVLTLLCWATVLFASLPFTDVPYMGVSLAALALLARADRELQAGSRPGAATLAGGLALALAATSIRSIGVAMAAPALVLGWRWLRRPSAGRLRPVVALVAVAVVVVVGLRGLRSYATFQPLWFLHIRPGRFAVANLRSKVAEWGELAVNVPVSKLIVNTPPGGQSPWAVAVWVAVAVAGGIAIVLAVRGLAVVARRSPVVAAYALAYTAVLGVWLTDDPRLWLPVLPLAMASVALGMRQLVGADRARPLLRGWAIAFATVGLVGLGWSARAALSREAFLDLYQGRRAEREVYERFLEAPEGSPERAWDRGQLATWEVLRRYGR